MGGMLERDATGPAVRTPNVARTLSLAALVFLLGACAGTNHAKAPPQAGAAPLHFPVPWSARAWIPSPGTTAASTRLASPARLP